MSNYDNPDPSLIKTASQSEREVEEAARMATYFCKTHQCVHFDFLDDNGDVFASTHMPFEEFPHFVQCMQNALEMLTSMKKGLN